jgi:hypothetical protein
VPIALHPGSTQHRIALTVLVAACSPAAGTAQGHAEPCVLEEISRRTLGWGPEREVYVEPRQMIRSGDAVFVAGPPVFRWGRNADGVLDPALDTTAIGVVIAADGSISIPRVPEGTYATGAVRAAPDGAGGWHFVHLHVLDPELIEWDQRVLGAWYGRFDGTRWLEHEAIPLGTLVDGRVIDPYTSRLLAWHDTVAIAVIAATSPVDRDPAILRRVDGRWSAESIPVGHANYVDLERVPGSGLALALVHTAAFRSEIKISLAPNLRHPIRVYGTTDDGQMHHPLLVSDSAGLSMGWWLRDPNYGPGRTAMIAWSVHPDSTRPLVVGGPVAKVLPALSGPYGPSWVVQHDLRGDGFELRLHLGSPDAFATIPYPFHFPISWNVVFDAAGELLLVGGVYDEERLVFNSELHRFRIACDVPASR